MSTSVDLNLHPKQVTALRTTATEVLYGGAAGGGKSFLIRAAAIIWCASIPGLQVYLFRRIRDDLIKNHMEGPKGFRALLAGWQVAGFVEIVEDEIRFWNGAKIYLCHCKDEKDRFKYQGAEIHVLLIDELTHFTEKVYRFLRNRVRMVGITLPAEWAGMFPRILCGSNPGNIGHLFVKETFVAQGEFTIVEMSSNEGGMRRQYIPARLHDNPSMAEDDPGYEARLDGLGSVQLVRAMRWGDWDVIEGAFFEEWREHLHVIEPFEVPKEWARLRAMDWGSAKPFSVGWYAVADGTNHIPRGCLVKYREWYGKLTPNVGLKLTAEEVAEGVSERSAGEKYSRSVADPSIFSEDGGPSIAHRMAGKGVIWSPADNKRVSARGAMGGWDQMRARLKGEDGKPMLVFFKTCLDSIRTIPALQHDEDRPEDVDTDAEDHAADETRYACMSRPWLAPVRKPATPRDPYAIDESVEGWKVA